MAYPIKDHQVYNMVLLHPDVNNTSESWTSKGSKKQMLDFYGEWCPSESSRTESTCDHITNGAPSSG
jgi:salicylate hydroxylase